MIDAFRRLDLDGSGSLSAAEFGAALQRMEPGLSQGHVERLVQLADKVGSWGVVCVCG